MKKPRILNKENIKSFFIARPDWASVFKGYPRTPDGDDLPADKVFKSVLGDDYPSALQNACATRVSLGLLHAKIELPKPDYLVQVGTYKDKGFITTAQKMYDRLSDSKIFGTADVTIKGPSNLKAVQDKIGKGNGIYIILGGFEPPTTGHCTLWLEDSKDVIGGHNYANPKGTVYFWKLT